MTLLVSTTDDDARRLLLWVSVVLMWVMAAISAVRVMQQLENGQPDWFGRHEEEGFSIHPVLGAPQEGWRDEI